MNRATGLCLLCVAMISIPAALACSCIPPPPPAQALQQSSAVFLGKVTALDDNPGGQTKTVTLSVEKWWKGGDAAQVKVVTANNSAACGFGFQKDGRYLVYAFANANGGVMNVSLCSRTADAKNAQAAGDFQVLGAGVAPK